MIEEIAELVRSGDERAAVRRVQRRGSPREIAQRFDELVRGLYWNAKDVPSVIAIGRAGIDYCLTRMAESSDADEREFFGSRAKALAFNMASFLWPGWDEAGIALTRRDIEIGLEAAETNLRLATELGKPADRVQDAHWLLGACKLATNDPTAALSEFHQCSPHSRPLYHGYVLLAQMILGQAGAQHEFDALVAAMSASPGEGDRSNALQLATACRVFATGTSTSNARPDAGTLSP